MLGGSCRCVPPGRRGRGAASQQAAAVGGAKSESLSSAFTLARPGLAARRQSLNPGRGPPSKLCRRAAGGPGDLSPGPPAAALKDVCSLLPKLRAFAAGAYLTAAAAPAEPE